MTTLTLLLAGLMVVGIFAFSRFVDYLAGSVVTKPKWLTSDPNKIYQFGDESYSINQKECKSMKQEIQKVGNLEIIKGTEGEFKFAIFAKHNNQAIAFRPLFGAHDEGSGFAFRIRAVPHTEAEEEDSNVTGIMLNGKAGAMSIINAFPGFQFQKVSPERCSLVGAIPCKATMYQLDLAAKWFKDNDLVGKILIPFLEKGLTPVKLLHKDEFMGWLTEQYLALIQEAKGAQTAQQGPSTEKPPEVVTLSDYKEAQEKAIGESKISDSDIEAEAAALKDPEGEESED